MTSCPKCGAALDILLDTNYSKTRQILDSKARGVDLTNDQLALLPWRQSAKNRAIADLVGGGEVSAEEMASETEKPRTKAENESPPPSTQDLAPSDINVADALKALKWIQSSKLPQLSTIKVTPALLGVPTARVLFDTLKASAGKTSKVGDVTYKLSTTDIAEFLQRWQATHN